MTEHRLQEETLGLVARAAYDSLMSDLSNLWVATENGEPVDGVYAKVRLEMALTGLTDGSLCVVQRPDAPSTHDDTPWLVHVPLKQAILMAFRFFPSTEQGSAPIWWDKIPLLHNQDLFAMEPIWGNPALLCPVLSIWGHVLAIKP
jgi:hypothetical protein